MPIFGIDVSEWVALIALISTLISIIVWASKIFIINPLSEQIQNLSDAIKTFNKTTKEQQHHLTKQDDRMDRLDVKMENHDTRIHNLENIQEFDKRKDDKQ